jgi:hypothetical protein
MPSRLALIALTVLNLLFPLSLSHAAGQEARHFTAEVVTIHGEEFVVKDESGTEGTIHVGTNTEKYGHFQPGDYIDAWVYPDGHAKTIIIARSAARVQEDQLQQHNEQQAPR